MIPEQNTNQVECAYDSVKEFSVNQLFANLGAYQNNHEILCCLKQNQYTQQDSVPYFELLFLKKICEQYCNQNIHKAKHTAHNHADLVRLKMMQRNHVIDDRSD